MLVNADFLKRVSVHPSQYHWVKSPQPGVDRVMLDRIGQERARATSIVRYAKGADFPQHAHPGGEEILVLDGVFCEGDQHYPAGWYLRNPPGSKHHPSSTNGSIIFVKLAQMPNVPQEMLRLNTNDATNWTIINGQPICSLYQSAYERVWLQRMGTGVSLSTKSFYGTEILVVSGSIILDFTLFERGSWIRLPEGDSPAIIAGKNGATIYVKADHLKQHERAPI